jgi:hypothetical protein
MVAGLVTTETADVSDTSDTWTAVLEILKKVLRIRLAQCYERGGGAVRETNQRLAERERGLINLWLYK